ncbi:flagella basal body P-ring formation protein FlgA [bacterium]|nr:MAG: flagella basal body P-ring formation protein FlgA [bacterium]RIK65014.1 MAG: flagella basal body P-ring formation protein FlgA [Planctomycetota bacterium]
MRIFLLALLLGAPLFSQSRALAQVVLADRVRVDSAYVSLAQLGTLSGDSATVQAASAVLLGKAPAAGETRAIEMAYIRTRLLQSGVDADKVAFYGYTRPLVLGGQAQSDASSGDYHAPPETRDAGRSPALPGDRAAPSAQAAPAELAGQDEVVRDALERLKRRLQAKLTPPQGEIEVRELSRSRALLAVSGGTLLEVKTRHAQEALGKLDYELTLDIEGRTVSGLTLSVEVGVRLSCVALTRDARAGERITPDMCEVREHFTTRPFAGLASVESALGRELTRTLRAGDWLTESNTKPALLVRKGESVTLRAPLPGGGVLTTAATAMESGAAGERIRVRRARDAGPAVELVARVTAAGECEVE